MDQEQSIEEQVKDKKRIGDEFYDKKEYPQALQTYEEALHLLPDNPILLNNKGRIKYALHQYLEALKCFQRAVELDPNSENVVKYNYNVVLSLEKLHAQLSQLVYSEQDEQLIQFCNRHVLK